MFRRAGVFAGGCDLEALAAVAVTGSGDRSGSDPLELAAELQDLSLMTVTEGAGGEPRVGMLETIREYALERLAEAGKAEETWTPRDPCWRTAPPSPVRSAMTSGLPRH